MLLAFESFAFVVEFLSARHAQFEFHAAVFEINFGRNQGEPLLINFSAEFGDLFFMKQKLAHAHRIESLLAGELVRADVHIVNKNFAVFYPAEGLFQVDLALADRFDLASLESDARFIDFVDEVVMKSLFVGSDNFNSHAVDSILNSRMKQYDG